MSKPNAYRLGDYIFKLSSDRPLPQYTNYDLQVGFLEKELIGMGAIVYGERVAKKHHKCVCPRCKRDHSEELEDIPVESKQIEKIERIKKWLDIVQEDTEYNLNKVREIIDHLQKG